MNRRTVGVVLLVAGVLVFLWAMSQISNMPPDFLMPYAIVQRNHQAAAMYRIVEVIAAVAAVGGGVLALKKPGS